MFKACFGNFIKNLKYVFVELGFMYLALMIGIDVFAKKMGIGFSQFKDAFLQMLETQDFSLFMEGINKIVEGFTSGIVGFFVIQLLGIVLGYILIMLMIRTDVERRNIFKVLLSAVVDGVILVLFILAMVGIGKVAEWGSILALLLFLPLYSLATLLGSYINHGMKLLTFRSIVSIKNILKLSIYNFIIILLTIALGILCVFITNIFVGLILMFALFMIGIATISLNADSFVNRVLTEKKIVRRIEIESDKLLKEGLGGNYGDVKIEKLANQQEETTENPPIVEDVKEEQPKADN